MLMPVGAMGVGSKFMSSSSRDAECAWLLWLLLLLELLLLLSVMMAGLMLMLLLPLPLWECICGCIRWLPLLAMPMLMLAMPIPLLWPLPWRFCRWRMEAAFITGVTMAGCGAAGALAGGVVVEDFFRTGFLGAFLLGLAFGFALGFGLAFGLVWREDLAALGLLLMLLLVCRTVLGPRGRAAAGFRLPLRFAVLARPRTVAAGVLPLPAVTMPSSASPMEGAGPAMRLFMSSRSLGSPNSTRSMSSSSFSMTSSSANESKSASFSIVTLLSVLPWCAPWCVPVLLSAAASASGRA
mmetsp:Transcript_2183/g.5561  ORF Transcript_2183/g.5561 Transcript_2183/m.5561 type:complete len:296 (+) Transcript_2183:194-1081(+)